MYLTIVHVHIEITKTIVVSFHPVYGWDNIKELEQPNLGIV